MYTRCVLGIHLFCWIYKPSDLISYSCVVQFFQCLKIFLTQLQVWIYFCYISPSKPAAQSPGSVCHTTLHKRLDLYSSWCSKCAVIAQSHMDSGVFIVSHQIYSSAVHVIMMLALVPHHILFPSQSFCMLFKGIVIMPVHCLHISVPPSMHCCVNEGVTTWLGIGIELCSNDPCWEVLQEQIWRCYPVNKDPAETSCEQHRAEMCDFKQGLLVPDSWWSAYHFIIFFIVIECDTEGKLECFLLRK